MLKKLGNFKYRCSCPVCFSANSFALIGSLGKGFSEQRLVMCKTCSHIMQNPYNADILVKYEDDTYSASERESAKPTTLYISSSLASAKDRFNRIEHLLPRPADSAMFDFGCGAATFMQVFEEKGYKTTGTEMSSGFWGYGLDHGYNVAKTKDLDNPLVAEWISQSNILSIIHVIEHLEYPVNILNSLFKLSPRESILVLEYPDYWRAVDRKQYFNPEVYFHEYHLHDFNFLSMKIMLASCGFRILQVDVWDEFPKDKNILIVAVKDEELKRDYNAKFGTYLPSDTDIFERYTVMRAYCNLGSPLVK